MNSVLNVGKSALKVLILWWVVVYDKNKTVLVSDPRHRIALVDFLQHETTAVSGFQGQRKSTHAVFLFLASLAIFRWRSLCSRVG
jgi:hypothetical protein